MNICILIPSVLLVLFTFRDIGAVNLVNFDLYGMSYKKLITTEDGLLAIPPLALLDDDKLKGYQCFHSIRSNKWTLAIPITFWNKTYVDKITEGIVKMFFFVKFKSDIKSKILPPAGFIAYRLNWRRKSELFDNNNILIDTSWYTTQFDYVLPQKQDFIIEFESVNGSKSLCNDTKNKLINEISQSQELSVAFMTRKMKSQNISRIHITIKDIKSTKLYNETGCQGKNKCFVSYQYAERWAYDVSSNVMAQLNLVHLSLQQDLYDAVLNYICKDKVPISEIEAQLITKVVKESVNETGCAVGKKVYSTLQTLCRDRILQTRDYDYSCERENINYQAEVIISMNSLKSIEDRNVFNIPVKRL